MGMICDCKVPKLVPKNTRISNLKTETFELVSFIFPKPFRIYDLIATVGATEMDSILWTKMVLLKVIAL